jgi:hypothetical protein
MTLPRKTLHWWSKSAAAAASLDAQMRYLVDALSVFR